MDIIITLPFYLDDKNFMILLKACVRNNIKLIRFNLAKVKSFNDIALLISKVDFIRNYIKNCNIILDIPFPKKNVRIFNKLPEKNIFKNEILRYTSIDSNRESYINAKSLNAYFKVGKKYLFQDGEGILYVEKVTEDYIEFRSCLEFVMRSGKSIVADKMNVSNESDMFIGCIEKIGPKQIWFSFVEDIIFLDKFKKQLSLKPDFFMKIETQLGIQNIESIISHSDGIVFARGDIAFHSNISKLLDYEEKLALLAKKYNSKYYIATDILSSMIEKRIPNRAEIIDLLMINRIGCDGIMLNAESTEGALYFDEKVKLIRQFYLEKSDNG